MKITVINGTPENHSGSLDEYLDRIICSLQKDHEVRQYSLREMKIRPCTGCFHCWIKTPGTCSFKDESQVLCREYISSDLVLYASPLIMGYPSALMKNAMDRMIPLIHPYLQEIDGEVHHEKRYCNYPELGLLLEKEEDTDREDTAIVSDLFERAAINVMSRIRFMIFSDSPIEEVSGAINNN